MSLARISDTEEQTAYLRKQDGPEARQPDCDEDLPEVESDDTELDDDED
jgi:hypothetical protein